MRHRRYWTSRGLLSPHAKFGNPYHIAGISQKQQNVISSAGKKSFKALASYERRFPERLGTIHADVHLGNVLRTGNGLGIIDFDDCGFGFAVYDIAVATVALTAVLGEKRKHEASAFKHALIAAYSQHAPWDSHDEEILPHLIVARRITMLAWFQSRSDNARLRKHFKSALTRALIFLRNETKGT
jgi:Ser/Thr protein kinase RdoA (MazF antagonist)